MVSARAVTDFFDLSPVGAAFVVPLDPVGQDIGRYGERLSADTSDEFNGYVEDGQQDASKDVNRVILRSRDGRNGQHGDG